jgi:acid phosphatase type 7
MVNYSGAAEQYYPQFYEPYLHYDAPIFAIPGNHDGDVSGSRDESLSAFTANFCAASPRVTPEAGDVFRQAMTQPNVYWTLLTPYATIIGLYTNLPEGGMLDQEQIDWFQGELREADRGKALIVAMHHLIFSADTRYSGSAYMGTILDQAIEQTNRLPDLVLAGHVHNYQRFTRRVSAHGQHRDIPYLVAGAGGSIHLHYEQKLEGRTPDFGHAFAHEHVTLERFRDNRHGFLRLEVSASEVRGIYMTVPRPHEEWRAPAERFDDFSLNLTTHQVTNVMEMPAL